VLFSDGLIEQTRHAEDAGTAPDDRRVRRYEFGIDRVLDVLARSKRPDDDTRRLLAAVLDFAAASALDDDTTIASIEWCEDESRANERPPSG
jgi:serine phosphatase RsbU (regulator of sigma subunit)